MAKALTIEVKGVTEMLNKIKTFSDRVIEDVDDELTATMYEIENLAKARTPVDTGRLRGSIQAVVSQPFSKTVLVPVKYAPYVEFGTGALVDVPAGLEDYAIQFKGRGVKKVNLPARPFLYPAFKVATAELPQRIKKLMEDEGRKL